MFNFPTNQSLEIKADISFELLKFHSPLLETNLNSTNKQSYKIMCDITSFKFTDNINYSLSVILFL